MDAFQDQERNHEGYQLGNVGVPLGGEFEYKGSDWMFTYNLGLMVSPTEDLRFGVSYRSSAHVTARGDYYIRGNALMNGEGMVKVVFRHQKPFIFLPLETNSEVETLRFSSLGKLEKFENMRFSMDNLNNLQPSSESAGLVQGLLIS